LKEVIVVKKLKLTSLLLSGILAVGFVSGCSSNKEVVKLDPKHKPLPDYVLNTSEKIIETYTMAATYPEVVASVPCYCGCNEQDGHMSNLDCYIDQMGPDNEVQEWDAMSIS
jgi:hypothetical protein